MKLASAEAPKCEPCEDEKRQAAEGHGLFLLGVGFFDFSELGDRLRANGYDDLPDTLTVIGGEGHGIFDSGFVVGARGGALLGADGDGPDGATTSFGGGFGMLDMGFALVRTRPVLLTLTGGVGGYGYSVEVGDPSSTSFDDALANPGRSTSLSTGGLLAGLTAGFDGRVPMGPIENGQQGYFSLGVRVGGVYGPALGGWSLAHGGEATGGPDTGLLGGFAAVAIGFGGGRARRPDPFE